MFVVGIQRIFRKRLLGGLLGLTLVFVPAASAQTYIDAFKDYSAALDRNDIPAAIGHGETAWEAAEAELGDNELTAILAFNYGSLVIMSDPDKGKKPLKRAEKLAKAGVAPLPMDKLKAYLAYVDYAAGPDQASVNVVRPALDAIAVNGAPALEDSFMWQNIAYTEAKQFRLWNAGPFAQGVIAALEGSGAAASGGSVLNNALMIRAASRLSGRERTPTNIALAHDDLDRIIETYGPQDSVEAFDPVLAEAYAWHALGHRELDDMGEVMPDHDHANNAPYPNMFANWEGAPEDCGAVWKRQPKGDFSSSGVYPGFVSAVLITYDIDGSGKIKNEKVLSAVPNGTIAATAMRTFKRWRLETAPKDHPGCRKNQVATFAYHAEWPPQ